ncbi:MAG: hypothetical protein R3190_10490, partial [Thermoanaerobaculia bacterium]|nr:hypothetical protein [Thermoanaerobaculia bacterium]
FDASAEQVRDALQRGGESIGLDPLKFDVSVDRYGSTYLIGFQGVLRTVNGGLGVDLLAVADSTLDGGSGASLATRMDGIGYFGFERIDLRVGDGAQLLNVQGSTAGSGGFSGAGGVAVTNIQLGAGDEQIFVSSNADLDFDSAPGFDFLSGHLHDVNGALNLDVGSGRHRLMISDEASEVGDAAAGVDVDGTPVIITDDPLSLPRPPEEMGFDPEAEIWITGLAGRGDLPEGGISYRADDPDGNFYDGIFYWSGSGDDSITIDGTHLRRTPDPGDADRTMTLLNTGLGDDDLIVTLDLTEDGFFSLNTMGGGDPDGGPVDDDDTVDASGSTLPLVFFGGLGDDDFTGGQNRDILFGDFGRVQFVDPETGEIIAVLGFGGRGDLVSPLVLDPDQALDPTWVLSRALTEGGSDVLQGHLDEDILIGGARGDWMDGDEADDLLFGDAVLLVRRQGDVTQERFQSLLGSVLYDRPDLGAALLGAPVPSGDESGRLLVDGTARPFRSRDGQLPSWAEYQILDLYHSSAVEQGLELVGSFGGDYMAGGADDDQIFGQLGDDVVQGDGSIESALEGSPVGARRVPDGPIDLSPTLSVDSPGPLDIQASQEAASDGDDYIEGGGGNDVVFGNLGQDDIVGGSSSFFSLVAPELRPDGADLIFGGSGQRIDANHLIGAGNADTIVPEEAHARDSDAIAGDNANIFRVVGTHGADTGGFLEFQYDQGRGAQRVLVRGIELLDYTPGGPDFRPDLFPVDSAPAVDIGGDDEVHGESGDDFVYGMVGRDVLFGDSEDDDLIGGWGADWFSGGTGSDGVIGDDGRIYTGRYVGLGGAPDPSNPAHYAELLNGVLRVDQVDKLIRTPGDIQRAIINEDGALFKQVDLTPFNLTPNAGGAADDFLFEPLFADDIIYGGLGDDFLHGSSGDDAVSGAEALAAFFLEPVNPGDALRFDPMRIEFADYDEQLPRTKLEPFFLNFDADAAGLTDEDAIFGDLGNDWIVGGPDNDHLYGGFGADLLNA